MDAWSFNRYPGKGGGSVTKALFHPLEPLPFGRWKAAQKKGAVFFEKGREQVLTSRLSLEPLPPGGSGRLRFSTVEEMIPYLFPCTEPESTACYFSGRKKSGGYILVGVGEKEAEESLE